jgi:hypothetical protein
MGFATKVQLIHRKNSQQWYINFPSALAQAMEFSRGEIVEWFVDSKDLLALKRPHAPPAVLKKKSPRLLEQIRGFWQQCAPSFPRSSVAELAEILSLSSLLCLGRHTVTGLLCTCGRQFQDWTAAYRLFSQQRFEPAAAFTLIRRDLLAQLPPCVPLCVAMDDSLLPKTGTKIPGVGWRRDPLGPNFQTNLIRARRVLQLSAALPSHGAPGPTRTIPIDFAHVPTPAKPRKNASPEAQKAYRLARKASNMSLDGAQHMNALRQALDLDPG